MSTNCPAPINIWAYSRRLFSNFAFNLLICFSVAEISKCGNFWFWMRVSQLYKRWRESSSTTKICSRYVNLQDVVRAQDEGERSVLFTHYVHKPTNKPRKLNMHRVCLYTVPNAISCQLGNGSLYIDPENDDLRDIQSFRVRFIQKFAT